VLLELLSDTLSMYERRLVGMPLGILFVVFNIIALIAVVRASSKHEHIAIRYGARATSAVLLLLSLWVPVYFYGRPLIVLDPDDPAAQEFIRERFIEKAGSEAEK